MSGCRCHLGDNDSGQHDHVFDPLCVECGCDETSVVEAVPHGTHLTDLVGTVSLTCPTCMAGVSEATANEIGRLRAKLAGFTTHREWAAFDDYGPIPWVVEYTEGAAQRLFAESDDVRVREVTRKVTDWEPYRQAGSPVL